MFPQALILVFLLFVAVLTYGWFYWQRAKARDAVAPPVESVESVDSASDQH